VANNDSSSGSYPLECEYDYTWFAVTTGPGPVFPPDRRKPNRKALRVNVITYDS
jgi:hypothetical protein